MKPVKICGTCKWCTEKNIEDQNGKCMEPHAPRNAKGQITSRTHLSNAACRNYTQADPVPEPVTMISNPAPKPKKQSKAKTENMLV